ncbi:MAG: DUF421 domain-containing protein [Caldilineaceae bacterium]
MLTLAIPVWQLVLRVVIIYLAILFGLRLAGKRELGQMTVFDFVVLLLIANAVQNAMVGSDNSLTGGLLAAAVLLALNWLLTRVRLRWPRLRGVLEGTPTLLVLHGAVIDDHLRREGLDAEMVQAALREHGIDKIADAEMAVLEIDGSISVVPKNEQMRRIKHPLKYLRHG